MYLTECKVLPVIQTWEPDEPYTKELLRTYQPHKNLFLDPLISVDVTAKPMSEKYFLEVIQPFEPYVDVFSKPGVDLFIRVCSAGMSALRSALTYPKSWDLIMYMEGDIILSSHLSEVWKVIQLPENLGLLTLYTPGREYETKNKKDYPIYEFPGARFYGIQCVLLPRNIVQDLVDNEHSLLTTFPGYNDIRWKEFLLASKKSFWCTHRSYAQHIAPNKAHKAPSNPHKSDTYYD